LSEDTSAMKLHTIFSLLMLASKFPDGITGGEAKGVFCGGHRAASCSECPGGVGPNGWGKIWHGASWCNGECEWKFEDCVLKVDASDAKASLDDYRKMQLAKHNKYRATHKSPSMFLDDKLNKDAQAWAEKLAANDDFSHDKNRKNQGENLHLAFGSHSPPDANDATDDWYSEVKNWDYKTGDANQECKRNPNCDTGHFTQVVWKGSVKLGIGKATGKRNHPKTPFCTWVVGRYSPRGNKSWQIRNNVLKP